MARLLWACALWSTIACQPIGRNTAAGGAWPPQKRAPIAGRREHTMPVAVLAPVPMRLHRDGPRLWLSAGVELMRIEHGAIAWLRNGLAGLAPAWGDVDQPPERWLVQAHGGSDLGVIVTETSACCAPVRHQVYRWTGDGFDTIPTRDGPLAWAYLDLVPWSDDRSLGLRRWEMADPRPEDQSILDPLIALRNPAHFEVVPEDAAVSAPQTGGHDIVAFDALGDGELFAVARTGLLHWRPGDRLPEQTPLPEPLGDNFVVRTTAIAPGRAFVHGVAFENDEHARPRLFEFADGWHSRDVPFEGCVGSVTAEADALWIVQGHEEIGDPEASRLWRFANDGWWLEQLPPVSLGFPQFGDGEPPPSETMVKLAPVFVHSEGPGDLWLVGRPIGESGTWALLHRGESGATPPLSLRLWDTADQIRRARMQTAARSE